MVETSAPVPSTVQSLMLVILSAMLCVCIVSGVNIYFDPQDQFGRNQLERRLVDQSAGWSDEIPFKFVDIRQFKRQLALRRTSSAKVIALGTSRLFEMGALSGGGQYADALNLSVDMATVEDYWQLNEIVVGSGASLEGKTMLIGVHHEFFLEAELGKSRHRQELSVNKDIRSSAMTDIQYLGNLKVFWRSLKAASILASGPSGRNNSAAILTLNVQNGWGTFNASGFPGFAKDRTKSSIGYLERRLKSDAASILVKEDDSVERLRGLVNKLRSLGLHVVLFAYPLREEIAEFYRTKAVSLEARFSKFGEDMVAVGAERAGQWPGEKALCSDTEFFDEGHFNSNCLQRSLAHRVR